MKEAEIKRTSLADGFSFKALEEFFLIVVFWHFIKTISVRVNEKVRCSSYIFFSIQSGTHICLFEDNLLLVLTRRVNLNGMLWNQIL